MSTHKELDIWKRSIRFVTDIYSETKRFPKEEMFGLTSQIRRFAVSIPSNIAKGAARKNKAENIQSLHIALGSYSELETQLIISRNLKYLDCDRLFNELSVIGKMLVNFIKFQKNKR